MRLNYPVFTSPQCIMRQESLAQMMLHNSREKNGSVGLYPVLYGCEKKRDGSLERTNIP